MGSNRPPSTEQLDKGACKSVILDWSGQYPDPEAYLAPLLELRVIGRAHLSGRRSCGSVASFWSAPGLEQMLQASDALRGPARLGPLQTVEEMTSKQDPHTSRSGLKHRERGGKPT